MQHCYQCWGKLDLNCTCAQRGHIGIEQNLATSKILYVNDNCVWSWVMCCIMHVYSPHKHNVAARNCKLFIAAEKSKEDDKDSKLGSLSSVKCLWKVVFD